MIFPLDVEKESKKFIAENGLDERYCKPVIAMFTGFNTAYAAGLWGIKKEVYCKGFQKLRRHVSKIIELPKDEKHFVLINKIAVAASAAYVCGAKMRPK